MTQYQVYKNTHHKVPLLIMYQIISKPENKVVN